LDETITVPFLCHVLSGGNKFFTGALPPKLVPDAQQFDRIWDLHPAEFHEIKIHGRLVLTPRWQRAYGKNYYYAGRVNRARSVPPQLASIIDWARNHVDERLNGFLLNWYDGNLGHYIGRHRDSRTNMVVGGPIVTISLGEQRTFRLRPWPLNRPGDLMDCDAQNGDVVVIPYETNLAWTHEVPASKKLMGRRISITLRAFV
jgi:alkylated DNA repair dioxygenase AlkB